MRSAELHCRQLESTMIRADLAVWVVCVASCVCLASLAMGISKEVDIFFKCEIYRKDLGEEREVEAESWNALEESLLGEWPASGG